MSSEKDFYEVLGIAKTASQNEIKKAYKLKAVEHHPDRNPKRREEASKQFKEIREAFEVLSDDKKRAYYDQVGHSAFRSAEGTTGSSAGAGASGFEGFASGDIFEDILRGFMGGGGTSKSSGFSGEDIATEQVISLQDAFSGCEANLEFPRLVICSGCQGSGGEKGAKTKNCGTCQGRGAVYMVQGFFRMERVCPKCGGAGQVIEPICKTCRGARRVRKNQVLTVKIPVGIEHGSTLVLKGKGNSGVMGGEDGDLRLMIRLSPHPLFQRDGNTLFCPVPLSIITAALGGQIEVPTINGGRALVSIPEGTQHGDKFVVTGQGMSFRNSQRRGDMVVQVALEVPKKLTSQQRVVLEKFNEEVSAKRSQPQSEGFLAKVKDFWNSFSSGS